VTCLAFLGRDDTRRWPTTFLGFCFPSAHAEPGIRFTRACLPATVRPQRFSRSRRLTPPESCPGLFHPGNAPGIRPSGVSPPAGPSPSRGPFLSCRCVSAPTREGEPNPVGYRGLLPPGIRSDAQP